MRILIAAFALAALAACASTLTYGPAAEAGASGYSETQIESNRYFVTYRARGGAEASQLHDYALLRAAELTLQQGGEWFWVDRRALDSSDGGARSGPSIGVGVGGGSWGGRGGGGVSVGVNFPLGGGGQRAGAATLEVRIGQGAKPDDANAYNARETAAALRARLPASQ
jgi:hypothetical protein